jgi:hypothetical protein
MYATSCQVIIYNPAKYGIHLWCTAIQQLFWWFWCSHIDISTCQQYGPVWAQQFDCLVAHPTTSAAAILSFSSLLHIARRGVSPRQRLGVSWVRNGLICDVALRLGWECTKMYKAHLLFRFFGVLHIPEILAWSSPCLEACFFFLRFLIMLQIAASAFQVCAVEYAKYC